ncbi:MAG: DNA translocase FtsK 4TM domain-containing protein [Candidatus Chromulinivorax sp.]
MKLEIIKKISHYWIFILFCLFDIFLCGSLLTFSATDNSWFYHSTAQHAYANLFGFFGSYTAAFCIYLFGKAALLSVFLAGYFLTVYSGMYILKKIDMHTEWDRFVGVIGGFFSWITFCQVYQLKTYDFSYPGGIVGNSIVHIFLSSFDLILQQIIVVVFMLCSFILISRCAYLPVFYAFFKMIQYCCDAQKAPARLFFMIYNFIAAVCKFAMYAIKKVVDVFTGATLKKINSSIVEFEQEEQVDREIEQVVQDLFWENYLDKPEQSQMFQASTSLQSNDVKNEDLQFQEDKSDHQEQVIFSSLPDNSVKKTGDQEQVYANKIDLADMQDQVKKERPYQLPTIAAKKIEQKVLQEQKNILAAQAKLLEEKLEQFDIKGSVIAMHAGPVVTLFEYQPDIKVKVSRILALEDDLAMALQALSIRIIAPIPGRAVVGFEIANAVRQDVIMSRIVNTQAFKQYTGKLPLILGQDTLGNDVISDLAKMPHLLIAGSTGSGKSVALNVMLVSLLCSLKPEELQLIIIDPKRLEFAAYDGIAHLIFPIVTDTKKAIPVLKWVVQTMEKRYEIMAKFGVRNLQDYHIAAKQNYEMEPMPMIVVIIDELADLMMTAGKAVEDSIARIAQMARAAGIHMIVATQRPSVDVITGMIKVNLPNRIAFKVTSKIDSRTILDAPGAEKLLGRGDMLFLDATKSHLVRVHGAYISDQEIHDVVAMIKKQRQVRYLDLTQEFDARDSDDLLDTDQQLYEEIIQFIQNLDEISISMLQRRFRIGYNRSARIVSMLESKGLIMSVDGGKTKRVVR